MLWGKKRIAGTVYDLTHLDPFEMDVPLVNGPSIRVQVQFGCHTFTEAFAQQWHTPDLRITHGRDERAFCLKRYGHSLRLPVAVQQAVSGRACNDKGRTLINARLPGLNGPYLIAFTIRGRKSRKFDGVLTVVSAHHRPNLDQGLPSAPFPTVVKVGVYGGKIAWK